MSIKGWLVHHVSHRRVAAVCCPHCVAVARAIWDARAARNWRTDPSDPGWREQDARFMQQEPPTNNLLDPEG